MRRLLAVAIAGVVLLAWVHRPVTAQQAAASQLTANPRVAALLDQVDHAGRALNFPESQARADEAMTLAAKLGDRLGLAMAQRAKGKIFGGQGLTAEATTWLTQALAGFEALGDKRGTARTLHDLAVVSGALADDTKAVEYVTRALKLFEEIGDDKGRAYALSGMIQYGDAPEKAPARVAEMLEIGRRLSDFDIVGQALKNRGDMEFSAGRLADARTSYEEAIAAFEKGSDVGMLGTCYLSLGRVFRAHGDPEGALQRYQRAIDILTPTADRFTLVQATNAAAIAYGLLNRHKEAIAGYERGLALARESGNERMIVFMEGNLAGGLLPAGEYARAIPALQAVIARKPDRRVLGYRHNQLAISLTHTGRAAEAVEPINEAVVIGRELKQPDVLRAWLETRTWILTKLGRLTEALADVREAIGLIDQVRANLIASDFLKRGYGDVVSGAYARGAFLLAELGRDAEALEFSEQGRARSFLDLLATRESHAPTLAVRGQPADLNRTRPDRANTAIARPVDASGISEMARRLDSTIVSYLVTDERTVAFVVRPGAALAHVTLPITQERLGELVRATTAPLRGPDKDTTTRGVENDVAALPMRGLGVLALSKDDKSAWRELYKSLLQPIRGQLPPDGRLTIVPHGPLLQLSFAALQNPAGRYLIEDYELHFAPSISMLEFTNRRQQAVARDASSRWTVIGNPAALPTVGERSLAPLPGAAREITSIAALAPGGRATRLEGQRAEEAALSEVLETTRPSLLHFATHGFVPDDGKTPPFLALNRRGAAGHEDGRLTLNEIYDLRLNTDLVVLSACRTGAGKVSSDGIVGLTRGFFYAGTPSVIATYWDVTDATTAVLMTNFYRSYAKAGAKSASLRSAQLALLRDLRDGKVVVTAAGRRVTLPEHPLLWAAFFLSGEP